MATDAITAEYLEDAQDFANELKENGREVSFGNYGANESEPWNPSSSYVEAGKAYILPTSWNQDFSEDVKATDLMFYASVGIDLALCKKMIDADKEYSVISVKPFKPAETVIFYQIQVRK